MTRMRATDGELERLRAECERYGYTPERIARYNDALKTRPDLTCMAE